MEWRKKLTASPMPLNGKDEWNVEPHPLMNTYRKISCFIFSCSVFFFATEAYSVRVVFVGAFLVHMCINQEHFCNSQHINEEK